MELLHECQDPRPVPMADEVKDNWTEMIAGNI
jgi:hypothetical protein